MTWTWRDALKEGQKVSFDAVQGEKHMQADKVQVTT
jgi:cold shock CspA family protein